MDRVLSHTDVPTSVGDIYEVTTANVIETVRVLLVNTGPSEITYSLYWAPNGVVHSEDHKIPADEILSYPGSVPSVSMALKTGDIIRAVASVAGLKATINGIQETAA